MSRKLFRPEAVEFQRQRLMGQIVLQQSISSNLLLAFFVLLAVGIVLFFALASFTRKEHVSGYIVPAEGVSEVYPTREGTVDEVLVENGRIVEKGTPLISLSFDTWLSSQTEVQQSLILSMEEQIAFLEGQLGSQKESMDFTESYLNKKIARFKMQVENLKNAKHIQNQRLEIAENRFKSLDALKKKNLVSDDEKLVYYQQYLDEQLASNNIEERMLQLEEYMNETQYQIETLTPSQTQEENKILTQINALRQEIIKQKANQKLIITAPISGRVTSLQAYKGLRMLPQQLILAILPENTEMEADLFIPTRAIGFLEEGQQVQLRYDAFPFERFGSYPGTIKKISKTLISPNQISVPFNLGEPVYRARITLQHDDIEAYGKRYPLQAGMLLQADIFLENRPLYQWLLKPLYSIKGKI